MLCESREPGCHGSCEKYIEWTKIRDERRVQRPNYVVASYIADKSRKNRR